MLKRFFGQLMGDSVNIYQSVLPFLPPCTLRDIYSRNILPLSPMVNLPLCDNLSWATYSQQLIGHSFDVSSVTYSPDEDHIVSGGGDGTIRIWERSSCAIVRTLRAPKEGFSAVAVSPASKNIISGSADIVRVWDIASGHNVRTMKGHGSWVECVAVSKDGKWVASGSRDQTVRLWVLSDGKCQHIFTGHSDYVRAVSFSPKGDRIVSGSDDCSIRVWGVTSGDLEITLDGHSEYVTSVQFTPDGDHILSSSIDKTLRIWDVKTGDCVHTIQVNTKYLNSVAVSKGSQHIISGDSSGLARVWDLSSGSLLNSFQTGSRVNCVDISSDSTQIVAAGEEGGLCLWDLSPHYLTPLKSVEFTSHGQSITATFNDDSFRVWKVGTLLQEVGAPDVHSVVRLAQGPVDVKYSYAIAEYNPVGADPNTGELVEKWDGGERVVCRIPISLYRRGSSLIYSGRHVVLWHEEGHLVHLDCSNSPPLVNLDL